MKRIILQGDGGSWRGAASLEFLRLIEKGVGRPTADWADLISGCSTFAIAGGCLSVGVSAEACQRLYIDHAKEVFKARLPFPWNWNKPKFDREVVLDIISDSFATSVIRKSDPTMNQLLVKFMCTAVSLLDKRNHFFKSWEEKDGKEKALEVIARSFAAALYFGAIDDPANKQVWADGGEALQNCTLGYAINEAFRQDWVKDGVYVISLGCGYVNNDIQYSQRSKVLGVIDETKTYLTKLGRQQSVNDQLSDAAALSTRNDLAVHRLDFQMPEKMDSFTDYEYIPEIIKLANTAAINKIDNIVKMIKTIKGW